jgi:C1A family cysteine protease
MTVKHIIVFFNGELSMRFARFFAVLTTLTIGHLGADLESHTKYGLAPLRDHEIEHLEHYTHKVIKVIPNALGSDRIKKHFDLAQQSSEGLETVDEEQEEYNTLQVPINHAAQLLAEAPPLPSSVDNSHLPSFPPIGDQGSLGSCVGWASTYYQASHELGLLHGWDNKNDMTHVLSPKWTYNLINEGKNLGATPVAAYNLLSTNGAASIRDCPYDLNYTSWDLNLQDWISALNYRMAPCTLIPGLGGGGEQNLTAIKQALNNGHVLTFASFVDSWVFTRIKAEPGNPNPVHVGEYVAYWMNGCKGGHFMTIVGYDDDVWVDINKSKMAEPGKKGAFLIANSWGKGWGNKGFIWIAYDAFLEKSLVPSGPTTDRVPAGIYLDSCLISVSPKAKNYTPRLIAQFSISQAQRNQIKIGAGASSLTQIVPSKNVQIPIFTHKGGPLEFDGTVSDEAKEANFAIDLTDLIPPEPSPQRYYLLVNDNTAGHPTTIHSFSLIDPYYEKQINSLQMLPQSYDNESGTLFIDY